MNDFNMNGSFGSHNNVSSHTDTSPHRDIRDVREACRSVSVDQWIDIICCSIIILSTILAIIFWNTLSDLLFYKILFPIIDIGGIALLIVLVVVLLRYKKGRFNKGKRHKWFF